MPLTELGKSVATVSAPVADENRRLREENAALLARCRELEGDVDRLGCELSLRESDVKGLCHDVRTRLRKEKAFHSLLERLDHEVNEIRITVAATEDEATLRRFVACRVRRILDAMSAARAK